MQTGGRPLIRFVEDPVYLAAIDPALRGEIDWGRLDGHSAVQQYGKLAMTCFYNRNRDVGLGADWCEFSEEMSRLGCDVRCLLGREIRTGGEVFNPDCVGTFIQSAEEVITSAARLETCRRKAPASVKIIARGAALLQR